ncbi:MAG: IPTL-CTERM sorting domain-containing protein [Betaproteobacteria bacterium]|nr:IPTL-CTERM sorting domain-containing protein [Betaproteobacteria bacterium]
MPTLSGWALIALAAILALATAILRRRAGAS